MGNDSKITDISTVSDLATVQFDMRLIPEFDGHNLPVIEWFEKAELVCRLRGVSRLQDVLPLRLTGGAFSVYQQLDDADKGDATKIKSALLTAFAIDKFAAYEQFISRKLRRGESVDVFVADLRHLATLFGGVSDSALICAFVAGLPQETRHTLRASSRADCLNLADVISRARSLLVEETAGVVAASHAVDSTRRRVSQVKCRRCGSRGHVASECRSSVSAIICYKCHQPGHIARNCQGNGEGEAVSALPSSPFSPQ